MGQPQAKPQSPPSGRSRRQKNVNSSFSQSVIGLFGDSCNSCSCLSADKQPKKGSNVTWKDHMVEQFRFYHDEEWAEVLADFLTNLNTDAEDAIFQSDLFWADLNNASTSNNYAKNPFSFVRTQKPGETNPINPATTGSDDDNDPVGKNVVHQSALDENQKQDFFKDIKNMLETSDILDEKILSTSNKETWMDKAYDIKVQSKKFSNASIDARRTPSSPQESPKKNKNNADPTQVFNGETKLSFDYYKSPITVKRQLSSDNNTDPSAPSSRQSFKNSLDEYHNNTFVYNYPVEKESISQEKTPLNREENNQQQSEEDLYKALLDYRMVTEIIDKHFKHPTNPFKRLIGCFEVYFEEMYGGANTKEKAEKVLPSEAKEQTEWATKELQQFIRIMYEGVNIFYKLDKLKISRRHNSNVVLFARDNMINFLTSIVFTEKIHDTIFKLYQFQSFPVEEAFEKNKKRSEKKQPQDFGVSVHFSLNEKTIQVLKERNKIPQLRLKNNRAFNRRLHFENDNFVESEFKLPSPKDTEDKNKEFFFAVEGKVEENGVQDLETEIKNRGDPYTPAISMMNHLEKRKSPIHKLKTIVKVAELASAAVEKFYNDLEIESFKKLDSDQTLYIFTYILVKSKLSDVIAHCRIIQNFSTGHILDSISGYYATTLEACVNMLSGMNIEEVQGEDGVSPTEGSNATWQKSMPSLGSKKEGGGISSMS